MLTSFDIQGDAWSWWQGAVGRYQRGIRPAVGSVLVFRRTGRLQSGHVAVVSRLVDRRTILVDHSWLEGNVLHRGMKVVDTSPNNSWSAVRVWNDPSATLGLRTYPTFGFVYPRGGRHDGLDAPLTVAANENEDEHNDSVVVRTPRSRMASQAVTASLASMMFTPHHKPQVALAQITKSSPPARNDAMVVALAPGHKPDIGAARTAATPRLEFTEAPQIAVPRHKPGTHSGHANNQVAEAHNHDSGHDNASEIGD